MRHILLKPIITYSMIIAVLVLLFFVVCTPTRATSAHIEGEKTVKSVLINKGDSLWSIASEYHTELDGSMEDYVDEIRRTNQLDTDAIQMGQYLVIPYYIVKS